MKILNKLIKFLGGYTKEEYDRCYQVAITPIPIVKETIPIITTLKACHIMRNNEIENGEAYISYTKEHLAKELAYQMMSKGIISYTHEKTPLINELEAVVKVVDSNQNENKMLVMDEFISSDMGLKEISKEKSDEN